MDCDRDFLSTKKTNLWTYMMIFHTQSNEKLVERQIKEATMIKTRNQARDLEIK